MRAACATNRALWGRPIGVEEKGLAVIKTRAGVSDTVGRTLAGVSDTLDRFATGRLLAVVVADGRFLLVLATVLFLTGLLLALT